MLLIIDEKLVDALPKTTKCNLYTVTDHQEKEWRGTFECVKELAPFWLDQGRNHKLDGTVLSRDVDTAMYVLDIREIFELNQIMDYLKTDISIVKTCLTHRGERLNMLIDANQYQERY